jgi:hypothetical protein
MLSILGGNALAALANVIGATLGIFKRKKQKSPVVGNGLAIYLSTSGPRPPGLHLVDHDLAKA